jgi:hypothetical protein
MIKSAVFSVVEWGISLALLSLPILVLVLTVLKFVGKP